MNMVEIIETKRYGRVLSDEQIAGFVKGVTAGTIPDYQISALLMAIVLNGMNEHEMTTLTLEMARSGQINDLSYLEGITVDKHSTGGVGDKVTPLLLPLLATFGINSVKLSGRGLGFTGGTVDKFESIEGFNCEIEADKFEEYSKNCGMVISAATPDLAPADKILYALRDVTATVDSVPLIASSIMSKKIAGGADAIVLDVTCGSGAFMKDLGRAEELSRAMVKIGNLAGRRTVAVITDMDKPLGRCCGNTMEMAEVFDTFIGRGEADVIEVVSHLAAQCVLLAQKNEGLAGDALLTECAKRLTQGPALEKYIALLASQGAHFTDKGLPIYRELPHEAMRATSPADGYVASVKTDVLGKVSVMLGAGRKKKGDEIDFGAGLNFYVKPGDKVRKGDALCGLCHGMNHTLDDDILFECLSEVMDAYEISDAPPEKKPAVLRVIS